MNNIYLIGFMGTGKTTVSCALRAMMNTLEVDMDTEIVKREKKTISEIFQQQGEEYFRKIETEVLSDMAQMSGAIISCGGGVVLREQNIPIMKKSGQIILLKAKPETIYARVKNDSNRPLLKENMTLEHIESLMKKRNDIYDRAKDFEILTDNKKAEEIAQEIIDHLKTLG